MKSFVVDLPSPKNISYFWKFGSLLGLVLVVQMVSGIFLSTYYISDLALSFKGVDLILRETKYLWVFRNFHMVGASMYFFFLFFHIGRGLYYSSWKKVFVWLFGSLILLFSMLTAFLGYVLPWGQMSYWGATVITNLLSAVPMVGPYLVLWVWGGFSVGGSTLMRFFSLHFLFPFLVVSLVLVHLLYLHESGSTNPLLMKSGGDKMVFFPYFVLKDLIGFFFFFLVFGFCFISPNVFVERENFFMSKPLVTPVHIQPEWYFLAAYAMLRSMPKKLSGVMALVLSVLVIPLISFCWSSNMKNPKFSLIYLFFFWFWVFNFVFLTWLGSMVVDFPYIYLSQLSGSLFFFVLFLHAYKSSGK